MFCKVSDMNTLSCLDIKCINEQHPRAGLNTQHVLYKQLARAGQIINPENTTYNNLGR